MIATLQRWRKIAADVWFEAIREVDHEVDHEEALKDNALWDEVNWEAMLAEGRRLQKNYDKAHAK